MDSKYSKLFAGQSYLDSTMLERLQLEHELKGHTGCVNCLDWNERGTLLASGSDDTTVMIWDPFKYSLRNNIQTGHRGNIFSVKFFPQTEDRIIASGAADRNVYIHDISHSSRIHEFSCEGRVKQLVASSSMPHHLWCASEDGMVREFDIRAPPESCSRVIIDLTKSCGTKIECKSLAICGPQPHLLAVGANDPFLRLYDRRMLRTNSTTDTSASNGSRLPPDGGLDGCVSYFSPGHIFHKQREYRMCLRYLCLTSVMFSPRGDEVLVNMGGEQVYLFDIHNQRRQALYQPEIHTPHCSGSNGKYDSKTAKDAAAASGSNYFFPSLNNSRNPHHPVVSDYPGTSSSPNSSRSSDPTNGSGSGGGADANSQQQQNEVLPSNVEELKEKANHLFANGEFSSSIYIYNRAIQLAPTASVLFGNRAAAYLKRAWDGDVYAALRDCYVALLLNPSYVKAHFRLARCLYDLRWLKEAQHCLLEFQEQYPDYAKNAACVMLEKDIKTALKNSAKHNKRSSNNGNDHWQDFTLSETECTLQKNSYDYSRRYCGHCNTTTDIKQANFFGEDYVVAGSDDGSFFIWEKDTTNLVRVMRGDDAIVNCLQPHPNVCMLASSGIDQEIRLWSPLSNAAANDQRLVRETQSVAAANQKRMKSDPFQLMLQSMGMHDLPGSQGDDGDNVTCSTS